MSINSTGRLPTEDSSLLSAIMPELVEEEPFSSEPIEEAEADFPIDYTDFASSECSSCSSWDFSDEDVSDAANLKMKLLQAVFYSDADTIAAILATRQECMPLESLVDILDSVCRKPYTDNLFTPFLEKGIFSRLDEIQKNRLFNVCIKTDNSTSFFQLLYIIKPESMDMLFYKLVTCQAFEILKKFVKSSFFAEVADEEFISSLNLLVLDMAGKNEKLDRFEFLNSLAASSKKETFKTELRQNEKLRKDLLEKAVIFNDLPLANRLAGYAYSEPNMQKLLQTAIRCKENLTYLGLFLKSFPREKLNKAQILVYIAENIEDLELAEKLKNMVRGSIPSS